MSANPYETERYLHEYLLFHYGKSDELCPFPFVPRTLLHFHERLRQESLRKVKRDGAPGRTTRALDIGCAVGRFTFELGKLVDEVVGVDNSRSFIRIAQRLHRDGTMNVLVKESGSKVLKRKVVLPSGLRRGRVKFQVGDALELSAYEQQPFDIVAAVNLLCRLPRPGRFLGQVHRLVVPGGQLLLVSPFSWLEEYTPRREWITAEQVAGLLRPHFHPVRSLDLPFLIREHRRKYQLVVAQVQVFRRK